MEETFATLRELDDVKQDMRDLRQTVSNMDANGTRGVIGLQQSLTDLIRDLLELKNTFTSWITNHEIRHKEDLAAQEKRREDEAKEKRETKRWVIFMSLTALGSIGGLYALIATHLH